RRGTHPSQRWRTFLYNQAVAVTTSWQTEGPGIANRDQVLLEHCEHSWVRPLLIRFAERCSETSRSAALQLALHFFLAFRVPVSPEHSINNCVRQLTTTARSRRYGRGRDASCPAPPAQIPACGFPALGSYRRSDVIGIRGLATHSSSDA